MATNIPNSSEDLRQYLWTHKVLIKQVREAQRATWFPLLLLAFVTFLAIPIEHFSRHKLGACGSYVPIHTLSTQTLCRVYTPWGQIYWPIALVASYIAVSIYYRKRSLARGVETSAKSYVIAGIVLSLLLSFASFLIAHIRLRRYEFFAFHFDEHSMSLFLRLISPAGSIGLALLYLARFERNRILFFVDLAYLVVVLVPINFGWVVNGAPWGMLPSRVIEGGILLIVGIGFALFQHRKQEKIS